MKKIFMFLMFISFYANSQVIEGAVGYGSEWTWNSSYIVRIVTNLNDSGTGSLRSACETSAGGSYVIVVFNVSGEIALDSEITTIDNLWIAGETSFRNGGQGITLTHRGTSPGISSWVIYNGNNNIVSFIRVRKGNHTANGDGSMSGDAFLCSFKSNVLYKNVETAWTYDESIDMTGAENITVQNSIIAEPLNNSSDFSGKTFQANGRDLTIATTIISNSWQRNPAMSPFDYGSESGVHYYEYINNIGFNLGSFGLIFNDNNDGAWINANIIGNYWLQPTSGGRRYVMLETGVSSNRYYLSNDNYDSRYRPLSSGSGGDAWNEITAEADDYAGGFQTPISKTYQVLTPFNTPMITNNNQIFNGTDLFDEVIPLAGCYQWRDEVSQRQIDNLNSNTTTYTDTYDEADLGLYTAPSAMSSAIVDSDSDGIPDSDEGSWGNDTFGYIQSLTSEGYTPPPSTGGSNDSNNISITNNKRKNN